jgi:hypothetical protein
MNNELSLPYLSLRTLVLDGQSRSKVENLKLISYSWAM